MAIIIRLSGKTTLNVPEKTKAVKAAFVPGECRSSASEYPIPPAVPDKFRRCPRYARRCFVRPLLAVYFPRFRGLLLPSGGRRHFLLERIGGRGLYLSRPQRNRQKSGGRKGEAGHGRR